jgi:hypothetical protein
VADLVAQGYLTSERVGRRNEYQFHPELPLRHPIERHCSVGTLVELLGLGRRGSGRASASVRSGAAGTPSRSPASIRS